MVSRQKKDLAYFAAFLAAIIVINIASSYFFARIDFTTEKRFTLTPVTRNLLKNLQGDIQITVYLEGEFPSGFKRLRNATRDLLVDFRAYSDGNLAYDFINPTEGNEEDQERVYQELAEKGIKPTNLSVKTDEGLSQKMIFPAALVTYHGQQIAVELLQNRMGATPEEILNNSIQNLEYAFSAAIKKASTGGKPRVGFTEGHDELSDLQLNDAMNSLQNGFEVGRIDLNKIQLAGLQKLKLLIVSKPDKAFSEVEKFKIDYFLMQGGRIFWAIDNVNADLDSLRGAGSQLTFPKKLNLDDMLFKYGVRVNYTLIADMNCAQIPLNVGNVAGQGQIQMVPWLFYPIFMPTSIHPLVKNLDGIRSEFANTVDTIAVSGIQKEVILASSPFSRVLSSPTMISLEMAAKEPDPKAFQSEPKAVGVLLEGVFPSNYSNRPVPTAIKETVSLPEKSVPTKMIVVGDGDILKNQVSSTDGSVFPLGFDRYSQIQYGNKNFFLNVVDFLTDDSGLIALRNKEVKIRLLDKVRIREEKLKWQIVNIALPLMLLIVFGIFQHYYRRQKYAH